MMQNIDRGQVNTSAAEVYEDFFVPALFQEWPVRVADAAHIQPGMRVLDVACGTGILARSLAERLGSSGSVVGLDINQGMLAVAKRKAPSIEWREGAAEALPFDDASFDAVVSQFGLMFFEDRRTAIQEMARVLRPGGRLAVAVWASLNDIPGYAAMADLLRRLFGESVANALHVPFNLGSREQLHHLFTNVNLSDVEIHTHEGTARFPSIASWVYTDVKGWTLADVLDDTQVETLLRQAEQELASFVIADGRVEFQAPAHIVTAVKV
jgi:SAM-dependent methyltransferase